MQKYKSHHVPINSGTDFYKKPEKKGHFNGLRLLAATAAAGAVVGGAAIGVNHLFQHNQAADAAYKEIGGTVTIEPGDTTYDLAQGIANKEHKDWRDVEYDIAAVNPGVNLGEVQAGEPINIPKPEIADVSADFQPVLPASQSSHQAKQ